MSPRRLKGGVGVRTAGLWRSMQQGRWALASWGNCTAPADEVNALPTLEKCVKDSLWGPNLLITTKFTNATVSNDGAGCDRMPAQDRLPHGSVKCIIIIKKFLNKGDTDYIVSHLDLFFWILSDPDVVIQKKYSHQVVTWHIKSSLFSPWYPSSS